VGGKGYSLIKMSNGGFPVPAGMVISVTFFDNWLEELLSIETLRLLSTDSDEVLKAKTAKLQQRAGKLQFTSNQRAVLNEKLKMLQMPDNQLFSVRSSSPEEDMEGASFAGMYETYLGVRPENLEDRVRDVFVSCIDYRVVAYKRQKGFDFTTYSIAVVVMAMIKSEIAGVAFSINPLNNCYDEIVINANFGLGESIVSGDAVPDQFVVDKYQNKILSEKIGDKKVSIQLGEDGGTKTVSSDSVNQSTLSREQILELAEMVCHVEEYYDVPMDTEWGYANGQIFICFRHVRLPHIFRCTLICNQTRRTKNVIPRLNINRTRNSEAPFRNGNRIVSDFSPTVWGLTAAGVSIAEKPGGFLCGLQEAELMSIFLPNFLLEGQKGTAKEYEGLDTYAAQVIRDTDISDYKLKYSTKGIFKTVKGSFRWNV